MRLFRPRRSNTARFLIWGAGLLASGAVSYFIRRRYIHSLREQG